MQDYSKPQILIVDDDYRILKLLQKFFEKEGFRVVSATCASDAIDLIAKCDFDLLILDVMLPGTTGIELTQKIRSQSKKMPVIMLTALMDPVKREEGIKSGADCYLFKPFEPKELLDKVNNLLQKYYEHLNHGVNG